VIWLQYGYYKPGAAALTALWLADGRDISTFPTSELATNQFCPYYTFSTFFHKAQGISASPNLYLTLLKALPCLRISKHPFIAEVDVADLTPVLSTNALRIIPGVSRKRMQGTNDRPRRCFEPHLHIPIMGPAIEKSLFMVACRFREASHSEAYGRSVRK
jgi:hypothetical protein